MQVGAKGLDANTRRRQARVVHNEASQRWQAGLKVPRAPAGGPQSLLLRLHQRHQLPVKLARQRKTGGTARLPIWLSLQLHNCKQLPGVSLASLVPTEQCIAVCLTHVLACGLARSDVLCLTKLGDVNGQRACNTEYNTTLMTVTRACKATH